MNKTTPAPFRERIDLTELQKWRDAGSIISDDRRRRPFWFDGRFLDAQALNAEQDYLLARLADYGRAAGFGVIQGLEVQAEEGRARSLVVQAGHGLTPSGAQVLLTQALEVDLAALAEGQRLDASFGLAGLPKSPPYNRSGLFVLALRAVEYTGEPITAYPTSLEGPRSTHDGSVIEATAVTLIPYADGAASTELNQRRRHVAREIFFEQSLKGQPEDVLPLAMLALDHGIVRWLDSYMVRRDIAQRERGVWGLGVAPRALRVAHLRQYSDQLAELQAQRGNDARFVASEHFSVLPPAGPLPVSGLDGATLRHSFFPAEMDVALSLVPEDEVPALLDEALRLPPIDLETTGEAQAGTSVLVLMAVPRPQFHLLGQSLSKLQRPLPPAQPNLVARRSPMLSLEQLLMRRLPTVEAGGDGVDSTWRNLLAQQQQLWYVRCRNLADKAEVVGRGMGLAIDEVKAEEAVSRRIAEANLKTRFNKILSRATRPAAAELTRFLGSPGLLRGPEVVLRAVVAELEQAETVDSRKVRALEERFAEPDFGSGLSRLEALEPAFASNNRLQENLARSGRLTELDRLARTLPESSLPALAKRLVAAGGSSDEAAPQRIAEVVTQAVKASAIAAPQRLSVLGSPRPGGPRVINRG